MVTFGYVCTSMYEVYMLEMILFEFFLFELNVVDGDCGIPHSVFDPDSYRDRGLLT